MALKELYVVMTINSIHFVHIDNSTAIMILSNCYSLEQPYGVQGELVCSPSTLSSLQASPVVFGEKLSRVIPSIFV